MAFDKSNPAWQADTHFMQIEKQHNIVIADLVEFLVKLGCDRAEALNIIREADQLIEDGAFDHMIE